MSYWIVPVDADQLRDLARRAANRTGYRQILVLGSQAVHGALPEVTLPGGWEGRVRSEQVTDHDDADNAVTLLFPEVHDLCASKLIVAVTGGFGRRSDRAFVKALAEAGHLDLDVLHDRIDHLPDNIAPAVLTGAHNIIDRLR